MQKSFEYFSKLKNDILKFEYFISGRTLRNESKGKKVSKPILRIAVISITLAVVVNLVTLAVVTGFQNEIKDKVSGFGSHLFITDVSAVAIYEAEPIRKEQAFNSILKKDPSIQSFAPVAYKGVIFQSDDIERTSKSSSGKDSVYSNRVITGAMLKGVDKNYDLSFFKKYLITGRLPNLTTQDASEEIVISEKMAKQLNVTENGELRTFFVKNKPLKRILKVVGTYSTGLEEFDQKIALGDIRLVQQYSDWGLRSAISIDDTLGNGQVIIRGNVDGSNKSVLFDWGEGPSLFAGFGFFPTKDTLIRLIVSENTTDHSPKTINSDTSYLQITYKGGTKEPSNSTNLNKTFLDETGLNYTFNYRGSMYEVREKPSDGTSTNYVSGYEICIKDWDQLDYIKDRLSKRFGLIPTEYGEQLKVNSIKDAEQDLFVWLGFLDINVWIVLTLMILIGIINMGSTLLVLILVRTNFIGVLKSMGATNWTIRKIFLYQAGHLIVRGMILGNSIALIVCLLQKYTGFLSLNPEVYYLTKVPIELNPLHYLILNIGTFLVCLIALIVPSIVITRIKPSKAIRFS